MPLSSRHSGQHIGCMCLQVTWWHRMPLPSRHSVQHYWLPVLPVAWWHKMPYQAGTRCNTTDGLCSRGLGGTRCHDQAGTRCSIIGAGASLTWRHSMPDQAGTRCNSIARQCVQLGGTRCPDQDVLETMIIISLLLMLDSLILSYLTRGIQ